MSNVELMFQAEPSPSCHLSGIVNGFTHVSAFAGDASATATALMLTVGTPKIGPISVGTGFERPAVRYTWTWTRLFRPVGPVGNVTSGGATAGDDVITLFDFAALMAPCTAGPPADRSV